MTVHDPSKLNVGTVIVDNDPRMRGRRLKVTGFRSGVITAHGHDVFATFDKNRDINIRSIHTDGKPRKRGFSVVEHDGE